MTSNFEWQIDRTGLVDCAMGRTKADLCIRNGRWVCVQTGEMIPATDIAIKQGHIAYIGPDARHTIGPKTRVIDAADRYLVPGLLDGHMHVESGMMTVTEFARVVAPRGTTGMFVDPHEIANVFGLEGVRLMVEEAAHQPIHVWVQMPSCVPSAPGLETPGSVLGPAEVEQAMGWEGIIGLGEMMNFPGVIQNNPDIHAELAATRKANKVIGGHYASPDLGLPFHAYAAGGPGDDHEGTRLEDAVARARQGLRVMLRYGSAWHDVAAQVRAITELGLSSRYFILCTDDSHSETLVNRGHMDRVIRHAITQGLPPMTAIQMATINTAEYFRVSQKVGMLAPGRSADIVLASNLAEFHIDTVIAKGKVIAEAGVLRVKRSAYSYPDWAKNSVHLPRPVTEDDFCIPAPDKSTVIANVIGVVENQAPTRHIRQQMNIQRGQVCANPGSDIAKVALVERHKGTGGIQVGLVQGFGFKGSCAVATTVAHDSHHLIVVGTDDYNMAVAVNELAQCGGGQVVVSNGNVIGLVELEIAGLMSTERAEDIAKKAASVLHGFRECGCMLNNPNMQLSLLALVVIPALRISDLGLVDVERFQFIPVLE